MSLLEIKCSHQTETEPQGYQRRNSLEPFIWRRRKRRGKKKKNTNKNAPQLCWFNCCVVDERGMKMRKEPQAFGWESFQNPTGNLCWRWGPEVSGKIQTHSSVLWIKPLIQKCVLRGEAPLMHSCKAQSSELLVLTKPANIFIINSPEQGFYPKF